MTRYLCWLGVLGVLAVPDWATACRPWVVGAGWGPPVVCPPPVTFAPVCPPPVIVAPPVYPAPVAPMLPPPRVEPPPRMATPMPAPAPTPSAGDPPPRPTAGLVPGTPPASPRVEPIRPASGSDTPVSPAPRSPAPETPPPTPPSAGDPQPRFPVIEIPKGLQLDPKPAEQPKLPAADTPLPPLVLPKEPEFRPAPTGPSGELPKEPANPATPSAAPSSPDPLTPAPTLPPLPETKKAEGFPPLVLPPDPVALPKPAESTTRSSTSRSSPLSGSSQPVSVKVFPAAGPEPTAGGYRTVGFYNYTDRDLALTIEGQAVRLPARSYLHAQVGPSFSWSHATGATIRETVPPGAAGLDVVFRN